MYNLPASTTKIDAKKLPTGSKEGITDFGRTGWGGPCPPSGTHRYFFKLYALDKILELDPGADKMVLLKAMGGHILQEASLTGRYSK